MRPCRSGRTPDPRRRSRSRSAAASLALAVERPPDPLRGPLFAFLPYRPAPRPQSPPRPRPTVGRAHVSDRSPGRYDRPRDAPRARAAVRPTRPTAARVACGVRLPPPQGNRAPRTSIPDLLIHDRLRSEASPCAARGASPCGTPDLPVGYRLRRGRGPPARAAAPPSAAHPAIARPQRPAAPFACMPRRRDVPSAHPTLRPDSTLDRSYAVAALRYTPAAFGLDTAPVKQKRYRPAIMVWKVDRADRPLIDDRHRSRGGDAAPAIVDPAASQSPSARRPCRKWFSTGRRRLRTTCPRTLALTAEPSLVLAAAWVEAPPVSAISHPL